SAIHAAGADQHECASRAPSTRLPARYSHGACHAGGFERWKRSPTVAASTRGKDQHFRGGISVCS
ncbi:unnamed protein product, partial [Closterium sp. NIES-53]